MRGYSYWPGGSHGKEGYWGPTTSTLDWCEENYVISHYVAEFWNSTSNLFFIAFAGFGMHNLQRIGATEKRHFIMYISLIVVALGSMAFHGTMWYNAQLADELPMIYNAASMLFSLLQIFPTQSQPGNSTAKISLLTASEPLLALLLSLYSVAITGIYLHHKDPQFLALAHGSLTGSVVLAVPAQISRLVSQSSALPSPSTSSASNPATPTKSHTKALWTLYVYALSSYMLGIAVWSVDARYCSQLRKWRSLVGSPWGILLELHVFWHLATAVGGYACILLIVYLRMLALGRKDVGVVWEIGGVFPVLKTAEVGVVGKVKST